LNLTFETREGILKHCGLAQARELQAREPSGVGARFIERTQPSLEAQLCNLADEIAYNAHDIDDGVRSGLLSVEQLRDSVPWFDHYCSKTLALYPQIEGRRWLFETIRLMLSEQVYDVIETTRAALLPLELQSADQVRAYPEALVLFSEPMQEASLALKQFLSANLYRHPRVLQTTEQAKEIIKDLFLAYLHTPTEMPESFHARHDRERAVADYIAGMTDRFAAKEHQRLSGLRVLGSTQDRAVLPGPSSASGWGHPSDPISPSSSPTKSPTSSPSNLPPNSSPPSWGRESSSGDAP
jgi:dGTPase